MRSRRRDQAGAVIPMVAMMTVLLITIASFAVDLGMQRVARRDMQRLADAVAMDLARLVDGRTAAAIQAGDAKRTSLPAARAASAARNSGTTVGSTPVVTAVLIKLDANGDPVRNANGSVQVVSGSDVPTAVYVHAETNVKFAFSSKSGSAGRNAVGASASTACFKIGSYAARLDSSNSALFARMLNQALGASVLSYQGLASSSLAFSDLSAQLGLGTVDKLASTTLTLRQLYVAAATVMAQKGDAANAAVLNSLAASMTNNATINLGSVLGLSTGSGAAAVGTIKVLDLVAGAAFVGNGSNSLSVPDLGTSFGLSGTGLISTLKLIEGAQEKCGVVGTTVNTAQADVAVTGTLASLATPASLNGLTLAATTGQTKLDVHLASATGQLTNIVCGTGTTTSPQGIDVSVNSQLAGVSQLTQKFAVSGTILSSSGLLGGLLGGPLGTIVSVQVTGNATMSATNTPSSRTSAVSLRYPNNPTTWDQWISSGTGNLGFDATTVTATWDAAPTLVAKTALGVVVPLTAAQQLNLKNNIAANLQTSALSPVISSISTSLANGLSRLLGLELGGADVYGVPTPTCNQPGVVG